MDMIVRLLGQNGQYDSAMAGSRTATWRVNQALDNLTVAMERQLGVAAVTTRQQEILALAEKNASSTKVDYALSLANQLDQQDELNRAEAEQIAMGTKWAAEIDAQISAAKRQQDAELGVLMALEQKKVELTEGAAAAKRYEIVNSNLSAETKALALSILTETDAVRRKNLADAEQLALGTKWAAEIDAEIAATKRQEDEELKLLSALEKRRVEVEQGTVAAKQYEIANSNLSAETKELALAILAQTDAAQKRNAAEGDDASKQAAIDKVTAALKRQAFEAAHGADALVLYDLKLKNATDDELAMAERLLASIAASKQAAADKTKMQKEINDEEEANRAFIEQTTRAVQDSVKANQQSTIHLTMKELAQRGATEEEIDAYYAAVLAKQAEDQHTAALNNKNAALQRVTSSSNQYSSASSKNVFAIQALAFGVQDAAQVFGTMGLAGALSASANNLIFMTSIINPQLSIWVALGVAAGQFAAVLAPMAFDTHKVADAEKELVAQLEKRLELTRDLSEASREFQRDMAAATTRDKGNKLADKTREEGEDIRGEIADRTETFRKLLEERAKFEELGRKSMQGETVGGSLMRWTGMRATPGAAAITEIDTLIADEQEKLKELDERRKANEQQQREADKNAVIADARSSADESKEIAAKQRDELLKQEIKDADKRRADAAKADAAYSKDRAALEKSLMLERLTDEQQKKLKVIETLGERQRQVDQWLAEGRISFMEANSFRTRFQESSGTEIEKIDQQAKDKALTDQKSALEAQLKNAREALKESRGGMAGKDLTAVEARSAEGMRRIFDALGGATNPQREIARATMEHNRKLQTAIDVLEKQLKAIEKLKQVKTG